MVMHTPHRRADSAGERWLNFPFPNVTTNENRYLKCPKSTLESEEDLQ